MDTEQIKEMIKKASELELELVWVPKIMERQTYDEVRIEATREKNNVGLNGSDAPIVTSIQRQIQSGKHLSPKQATYLRKALPKYAKQYFSMTLTGRGISMIDKKNPLSEDYYGQDV